MAYTAGKLALIALGNTHRVYIYDAQDDTLATVGAAGYFNNVDDTLNLRSEDLILVLASDGDAWFRFSSESSGAITLAQVTTGAAILAGTIGSVSASLTAYGHWELDSGTATAFLLPPPVAGAVVEVLNGSTATAVSFAVSSAGITLSESGATTITLTARGQNFRLLGLSTTRWRIERMTGTLA